MRLGPVLGAAILAVLQARHQPLHRWSAYVFASCGRRLLSAVQSDINSYYTWYGWTGSSWTRPIHFWHIVYDTPTAAEINQVVHDAYVYVTLLTLPNPYGALPAGTHWSDELSDIG